MLYRIINIYRTLFARRFFYRANKLLYHCSLSGLGILNYENNKISGESHLLKKLFKDKKNSIVFDVGANVGDYSKEIFEINPDVTIYAFEPHPVTYSNLVTNLQKVNFNPINAAAGEVETVMTLYDREENDGSPHASLYKDVIENLHNANSVEHKVRVLPLGEFARSINLQKIDLLKIDTEGNELNVLKGISEYIESGLIKVIHFEFNEMNVSSRTYFRDFWEFLPNYDFYRLLPDGMVKIETYTPLFCEIFAYQNIVAKLKKGMV